MDPDQRSARRFDLKLSVELLRCGSVATTKQTHTANISSSGVLLDADPALAVGQPLEYMITLAPNIGARQAVRLYCVGKVVRQDGELGVAATLERYEFQRA